MSSGGESLVSLFVAAALVGVTLHALRGGLVGRRGQTIAGMDPQALGMGVLAVVAAGWFWGPEFGAALIIAVAIHEFGHVAAYRVAGHADARFRLVPLFGGVAISNSMPATQMKDFFITLMGPGISVAPMVLAYVLSDLLYYSNESVGDFLYVLAMVMAALNFFNMLPFWPLDGGRCMRILAYRVSPGLARQVTFAMSAGLGAWALAQQSMIILAFALMGVQSAFHADRLAQVQHRLSWAQWGWALAAYLAVAGAHLIGGWAFVRGYLL